MIAVFIMSTAMSILNLQSMKSQFTTFYNAPYQVRAAANIVKTNMEVVQKSLLRSILTEDPAKSEQYIRNANDAATIVKEQFAIIDERFAGDRAWVDSLRTGLDSIAPAREKVIELAKAGKNQEAVAAFDGEFLSIMISNAKMLDNIIGFANNRGDTLLAAIGQSLRTQTLLLLGLGFVFVVVSILICFGISSSITKPVKEIERAANEMAEGKLDTVIQYQSRDELGSLSEAMRAAMSKFRLYIDEITYVLTEFAQNNFDIRPLKEHMLGDFQMIETSIVKMTGDISETITQIKHAADQVSTGSDHVSSAAQSLAQGATEQASSVQELSASITEISTQVRQNAENSQKADCLAKDATNSINSSNEQMKQLMVSMNDIDIKSKEISKIIKTIEDIAFQTNILALNAAVEAARAGAAGKGFSVVADEVRNLAGKSADAAKNTTQLIEESVSAISHGVNLTTVTAGELNNAVDAVMSTTELISEITRASNAQAQAIGQVAIGLDQISSVVQTNSATSEQSAAASEELSSQAYLMQEMVSKFKLKNSTYIANGEKNESY